MLGEIWPSPVVALNRAVAIGFADGPAAGLAALDALAAEPQLAGYGYLAAARADFLRRLGRARRGRAIAYAEALHLTDNEVEREFLQGRLDAVGGGQIRYRAELTRLGRIFARVATVGPGTYGPFWRIREPVALR